MIHNGFTYTVVLLVRNQRIRFQRHVFATFLLTDKMMTQP